MIYATTDDVIASGRTLSATELNIASAKLEEASAMIRAKAKAIGKDFEEMIADDEDLLIIAKSVVVSCVIRYLNDNKNEPAMTQMSQSVGGYSISGTYAASGARVSIWDSEWKLLGLKRQRIGVIDFYGNQGNRCNPIR